jgi:hypothetical protein
MILLKVTNDQLLTIAQDANYGQLVEMLIVLEARNSASGYKAKNKEGYIEIGEKYLSIPVCVGLTQFGVEFKPIPTYVEVQNANVDDVVPSYLPEATRTVMIDDNPMEVQNEWSNLESRVALDGSKIICGLGALEIDVLAQLIQEPNIKVMNVQETRDILEPDYQTNEEL